MLKVIKTQRSPSYSIDNMSEREYWLIKRALQVYSWTSTNEILRLEGQSDASRIISAEPDELLQAIVRNQDKA